MNEGRDRHSAAKGSPCLTGHLQGSTWQPCTVLGQPVWIHCLPPADMANGEFTGPTWVWKRLIFFLWLSGALPLPACARILSAHARPSAPRVQPGEERYAARPPPTAASAHCSGVCCPPAAPEGPARENTRGGRGSLAVQRDLRLRMRALNKPQRFNVSIFLLSRRIRFAVLTFIAQHNLLLGLLP